MGRRSIVRLLAVLLAAFGAALAPAGVAAHPLGNFTINHFAELKIGLDRVDVELVLDMAEVPAFQERQTMDADQDGSVSDGEAATWADATCRRLAREVRLARDGEPLVLAVGVEPAALAFPPGAGGLSTLRLECRLSTPLATPIAGASSITFADDSYAERIGWREILATGVGTILDTNGLPAVSPSRKLTQYPANLISQPLDIRSATVVATADPAGAASGGPTAGATAAPGTAAGPDGSTAPGGAVPGGVGGELPSIFRSPDVTPFVLLASLATAVVIGAGHALTPGHGKTLMAAYLVGSRGTAIHALGLGLSVAVSHTIGILVLALVILGAGSVLPPDVVYRVTPVIAGASIIAIGGWMLLGEVRRRRERGRERVAAADHIHPHGAEHEAEHEAGAEHQAGVEHEAGAEHQATHRHEAAHGDAHEHPHDHGSPHPHPPAVALDATHAPASGEHSHGGIRHSHLPPADATLSWRGLFVLGLAGGLIPSTSALLILLGSIAAGRPAFGLVLVVAFGLGMAGVMSGVGLAMIFARGRLDRLPRRSGLGRLAAMAPLVASVAVLGLGLLLTWQALAGTPVL